MIRREPSRSIESRGDRRVSRRLDWEILGVLGGALLVVALLLGWDGPERNLRGDQQLGNLIALKYLHPDALPGDAFYGPAYYRGFNPAFFSLQAWVARVTGEDGLLVKGPLRAGYRTELWTLPRIAEVIHQHFGVRHHPSHVWRILNALG
jgi:hypothetical protein